MTSLTAMVAALLVSVVLNKPGVVPGQDALIEAQTATIQISGASTNGSNTFDLDATYAEAADAFPSIGLELAAQSTGAADPGQITHRITSVSATQVAVRVDLETAPGSGETTDIDVHLTVVGHGTK